MKAYKVEVLYHGSTPEYTYAVLLFGARSNSALLLEEQYEGVGAYAALVKLSPNIERNRTLGPTSVKVEIGGVEKVHDSEKGLDQTFFKIGGIGDEMIEEERWSKKFRTIDDEYREGTKTRIIRAVKRQIRQDYEDMGEVWV